MSRSRISAILTLGVLAGLCLSGASRAEDGVPSFNISCGGNCGDLLPETRPNSLMPAFPGGTFVVTVAHVAPSPEDAIVRGAAASCDPVRFRIDTLMVKPADGSIEVELGDQHRLAPGEAAQVVVPVDPSSGAGRASHELNLMGFRLRSEAASSRCSVVAGGMFYATPTTTTPAPFAVIPSATAGRDVDPTGRR